MNPLISLVIPVYNVEKYLDKCIQFVFEQMYDNFKIILLDDGVDHSFRRWRSPVAAGIFDEYAKRDSMKLCF